jgi:hypothetical protein
MKRSQMRLFSESGVAACVLLAGGKEYLKVSETGLLEVPAKRPTGFILVVAFKDGTRAVVVMKNVGKELGEYHRHCLSELEGFAPGYKATIMHDPIQVCYAGPRVWTAWYKNKSNRVDIWFLSKSGVCALYQVGVITHDNGATWHLVGEWAWKGRLYKASDGRIVGKPEHAKHGSFEVRRTILDDSPEFMALVKSAKLESWKGAEAELNPPLPKVPGPGHAVINWYKANAGMTGQGPATSYEGVQYWVHGEDVLGLEPDADGIKRLRQGDVVSYTGTAEFGEKPNGPLKLTGVRLVSRLPE